MRLINLIDNCGQLLNNILKSPNSIDRTTETFFRNKRKIIGSKERKFISQVVFDSIRNLILIKNICTAFEIHKHINHPNIFIKGKKHSIMILIQILLAEHFYNDFYFTMIDKIKYIENQKTLTIVETICTDLSIIADTTNIINYITNELSKNIFDYYSNLKEDYYNTKKYLISQKNDLLLKYNFKNYAKYFHYNILNLLENFYSFPKDFIYNLLTTSNSINVYNILEFAKSMNYPASTCIRVNTSMFNINHNSINSVNNINNVNNVINILKQHGIESYAGKISPACIIIPERRQLTTLDLYKKGYFTIQDEASQLVGYCIAPNPTDTILDACAGAGGKSLHLADLQNDKGTIIATDTEFLKLKEIIKRASLVNYKSICTTFNNNIPNKKYDIVLVDVPCSGAGTIRRDPMKKYTILTKTINKIAKKQLEIITNYSKYVKSNGTLVYSTCSIFPQENEHIVKQFLIENNDFAPDPIAPHLNKYGINIATCNENDFYITLFPFINNTDGFFIARMRKRC